MAIYNWDFLQSVNSTPLQVVASLDSTTGDLTITVLQGSLDLKALWFDNQAGGITGGNTTTPEFAGMNGSGYSPTWDHAIVLSTQGFNGDTFLTAATTDSYPSVYKVNIYNGQPAALQTLNWDQVTLGFRAQTVNGDGSVKLWDDDPVQPPIPALSIDKAADVDSVNGAGDSITYTITVKNIGEVDLTRIQLSDALSNQAILTPSLTSGDNDGDLILDVGETWTYTAIYTVSQADMDAGEALVNTATVDTEQTTPQSDDATTRIVQDPKLTITKFANTTSVDTAGAVILYTITVTNNGNISLTDVELSDLLANQLGQTKLTPLLQESSDSGQINVLDVGETWTYTASYTVSQDDMDAGTTIVNTATVDTAQTDSQSAEASTEIIQKPQITFTKEVASVTGGYNGENIVDNAGDIINYRFAVTNSGNITLDNVTIADPLLSDGVVAALDANNLHNIGDSNQDGRFSVGETWEFSGSYTVTGDDIASNGTLEPNDQGGGQLDNTATATASYGDGLLTLTDRQSVPVWLVKLGLLKEVRVDGGTWQDANKVSEAPAGSQWSSYEYRFSISNLGGVAINGNALKLEDSLFGAGDSRGELSLSGDTDADNQLDLNETWVYTSDALRYDDISGLPIADGVGFSGSVFKNTATVTSGNASASDWAYTKVYDGPGVRTPGFWSRWTAIWDGNAENDGLYAGKDFFPDADILISARSSSPPRLLIGDWDRSGAIDEDETGFSWDVATALKVVNASQKVQKDTRYVLGRDVVASWLNYLAGNAVNTGDLDQAIGWLKKAGAVDVPSSTTPFSGSAIAAASASWQQSGSTYHTILDQFNNSGIDSSGTAIAFAGG